MTDTHSEETMNKAREMLSDMAELADYQPFNLTHSDWVMKMWKAFNKGREYEQFATEAEAREAALKVLLKSITISDLTRCSKAVFGG